MNPRSQDTLSAEWTKVRDAEEALAPLSLGFDRNTLDFTVVDQDVVPKLADDTVLETVAEAGDDGMRGPDLINGFVESLGISERTVRDRLRGLVKQGRLVELVTEADRRTGAKSYRIDEGGLL